MQSELGTQRGITFERVRDAVIRLTDEGKSISAGSIREVLGDTGSKTTILKHLAVLREQQGPPKQVDSAGFSAQLLNALGKEIARLTNERTSQLQSALEEARSTIHSLIAENERLGEEVMSTQASLAQTQRSIAEHAGVESELRSQLALLADRDQEAGVARQELARALAERGALEERLNDAKAALTRSEASAQRLLARLLNEVGHQSPSSSRHGN